MNWTKISNMPKSMPQGVIDTNVLVRAFLKADGSDGLIFKSFLKGKFELLYNDILLQELVRVLNYPRILKRYHNEKSNINQFIDNIVLFGKFVHATKKVKICRDPDDDELLSLAMAIYTKKPIYIVSGDRDLLLLKGKIIGIKIVTANNFLHLLD